jgi:transposase
MPRCQVGVKSLRPLPLSSKNTCKIRICRSGTPYEQDPEHRLTLGPRKLYSLSTIFGQQGAKPKRRCSVKSGDLYLDVHVAVALDRLGRRLGEVSVPTTAKGYESLVRWAEGLGILRCAGVEGTSSYGAGLARYLRIAAIPVMEVERPKRRHLYRSAKTGSRDAESAARTVLAGETAGVPKSAEGRVEMIRALRTARRSAMKART